MAELLREQIEPSSHSAKQERQQSFAYSDQLQFGPILQEHMQVIY